LEGNFGGKFLEGKTDASLVSWSWFGLGWRCVSCPRGFHVVWKDSNPT
jgi:hypothetical protein